MRAEWVAVVLPAWFVAMILVGAGMMARHLIALPAPTNGASSSALLRALGPGLDARRWTAVHVLAAGCRCSLRVAEQLSAEARPAGWQEIVVWIGDEAPPELLIAHFRVRRVNAKTLAELGVEAAPVLLVISPEDQLAYSGGYTERKQAAVVHDLDILARTRAGTAPPPLPLFGCATSARLKAAFARLPAPGGSP